MRVFIANQDLLSQRRIDCVLTQKLDANIVGEARSTESLLPDARKAQPDLVLLDWELPGQPTAYLVGALQALASRPKVVALSAWPVIKNTALTAGVDGFFCKSESKRQLLTVLGDLHLNDVD